MNELNHDIDDDAIANEYIDPELKCSYCGIYVLMTHKYHRTF